LKGKSCTVEPVPKLIDCALTRTVLEQALGKAGQNPGFSLKSREAVPKTEVLEQPQLKKKYAPL
jgi:hypothetical protein